jgi:hypothetical protein
LTALKARSLLVTGCAFGHAFLELCLLTDKLRFSALRGALLTSLPIPFARRLRSSRRADPISPRTLLEKSAFKPHS